MNIDWNLYTNDINGDDFNLRWNVFVDNLDDTFNGFDGYFSKSFYSDFYYFLENYYLNDNSVLANFSSENEAVLNFLEWLFAVTEYPEFDNIETVVSIWKGTRTTYGDNNIPIHQYLKQHPQQIDRIINN